MIRIITLFLLGLFSLPPYSAVAADVYIWTDKDGVTHIEDQAPKISPQEKIKVEKHVYQQNVVVPSIVNPEAGTLPSGPSSEGVEDTGNEEQAQKAKEKELKQQEIDKARQEYEEAKASEKNYLHRFKNADNSKARHYWKNKLEGVEEKRRQLEELEKSE